MHCLLVICHRKALNTLYELHKEVVFTVSCILSGQSVLDIVCLALAGMQGRAQGLDLPAEQTEAAGLLPVSTHHPLAGLQAANTEAMIAEPHLTTLSHSMPSRTASNAVAPIGMHPTPGTRTIPDPARMTSPGIVAMTGTGTLTEATTAAVHIIGTLAAEEEGAPATARAAGPLHVAESGKGTSLVVRIAAATDRRKALSMTGTEAETTGMGAATIVMTETGTQDPTETEAVAETGTPEAGTPSLALHSFARQLRCRKWPFTLLPQANVSLLQCNVT